MMITLKTPWLITLSLLLLLSILLSVRTQLMSYHFGLVDIQALVSIEAEKLAHLYPDGNVPLERLQAFTSQLKQSLEQFAQKRRLILFAKGAVYRCDLQDYTEVIKEEFENE